MMRRQLCRRWAGGVWLPRWHAGTTYGSLGRSPFSGSLRDNRRGRLVVNSFYPIRGPCQAQSIPLAQALKRLDTAAGRYIR